MSHTPGPWEADAAGFIVAPCGIVGYGSSMRSDEESVANERLMAAAPEMLEALMAFVDIPDVQNEREWPETKLAREAIAKATGVPND